MSIFSTFMRRKPGVFAFIAALLILIAGGWLASSSRRFARFHPGENLRLDTLAPFRFFGGDWTALSGVISDGRSGRGDLAVVAGREWGDFHISGDVRFDSIFAGVPYGDAGFVARVTQPDVGVDSFHGYYAGLRIQNQTLVLGKTDDQWSELKSQPLGFAVLPGKWYHLSFDARQCHFVLRAEAVSGGPASTLIYDDPNCFSTGAIGLRLFYVQASWRDVVAKG